MSRQGERTLPPLFDLLPPALPSPELLSCVRRRRSPLSLSRSFSHRRTSRRASPFPSRFPWPKPRLPLLSIRSPRTLSLRSPSPRPRSPSPRLRPPSPRPRSPSPRPALTLSLALVPLALSLALAPASPLPAPALASISLSRRLSSPFPSTEPSDHLFRSHRQPNNIPPLGMASGLDTLCGQAYGAQQYKKLGIHTYRAILSLILVCLPVSLIWVSMGKLLSFVGQDPLISQEAGKYAVWLIPGLFALAISQPLMKFLQSQSLILPMLLSSVATLCIHIPLCWAVVFKTKLGNVGAALSVSISYWINVLILVLYIKYSDSCKATRAPLSMEAFRGINEFLRLAIPSAVMICLEWWSFELLVLLSGLLPNPKLETSVLSICLTSIALLYTIPYGLGCAASTRISNELGAGNPDGAHLAVRVVMSITIVETLVVSVTLFGLRRVVGYAYSNEKEVVDYVREMVPLVSISVIMDGYQGVMSGIARGCGWQHIGAYVNLGAYYLVGIPTAVVLGFLLHIGGKGLWIGILSGAVIQCILLGVITIFTNWQQQAVLARKRVFEERLSLESGLK